MVGAVKQAFGGKQAATWQQKTRWEFQLREFFVEVETFELFKWIGKCV